MDLSPDTGAYYRQLINDNTQHLLFSDDYKEIYDGVHGLHNVFSAITGIKAGDITDQDIMLPNGKAISPIKAAHCLLELERTRRFLRGIYKAILELKGKIKGRRIHILYAGCGPYATLLTPITSMFGPDEIAFSLLDINETSIAAARRLYETLDLTAYIKEYILTDATTYQLNADDRIDMILSETMLNALQKEPMVAIMDNLIPQLPEDGIFIPEEITVDAALLNSTEEMAALTSDHKPKRIKLGMVYSIGKAGNSNRSPVTLPVQVEGKHCLLNLLTEIKVFGDEKLTVNNCSLTMPYRVAVIKEPQTFNAIRFEYEQGVKPHFKHQFLNL